MQWFQIDGVTCSLSVTRRSRTSVTCAGLSYVSVRYDCGISLAASKRT